MSNSIDIPTRDRRPRRMRYQESPFAQTQPQSPAPSADAGPAGSDAYSKANSEYGRLYVDSRSSLPSSSLYSTSSPFGTPSSYDAAVSSVDGSPAVPHAMSMAERRAHDKGKGRAVDGATASPTSPARGSVSERRTSFMGESIARAEHTVIDIGDPDGTPRLITCVKNGQGWQWNQDLLLPSYLCDRSYNSELERRQDPVQDIILTDEEMQGMLPQ